MTLAMLPKVVIHNAVSVDGRIDWFTPDIGQFYRLASTWHEDATLAGSETVRYEGRDVPEPEGFLKPRQVAPDDTRPLIVIPDSQGKVRNWHALLASGFWRDGVALCTKTTPADYLDYLSARYISIIIAGEAHVDFKKAFQVLKDEYAVDTVRVDSGGTLNGILLREGLVDEVSLLIYPSLVGGTTPKSFFRAPDLTSDNGVVQLSLVHFEKLDNEAIWLRYSVRKPGQTRP